MSYSGRGQKNQIGKADGFNHRWRMDYATTVGVSGEYTDIQAALDANFKLVFITSDISSASDVVIPSGSKIEFLGPYSWQLTNAEIRGTCHIKGPGTIAFAGAPDRMFSADLATYSYLRITDAVGGIPLIAGRGNRFDSCTFTQETNASGIRNEFANCRMDNANLVVSQGAVEFRADVLTLANGVLVDNGADTNLSDVLFL